MSEIISQRETVEVERYALVYYIDDDTTCAFSFDCDKDGNLTDKVWNPAAQENYEKCVDKVHNVLDPVIEDRSYTYNQPAILKCDCGEEVELYGFTNTCDKCYRDYNSGGQRLAPREQWGEETGESLGDILRIQ